VFLAVNGLVSMAFSAFPSPIDELQHLSYIRWEEAHPTLFPRYETMRTLAPDLIHWGGPAWTTHPSLYYLLLAPLDAVFRSVAVLRLANLALALLGAALMLRAGFEVITDQGQRAIYSAIVVLFPKTGIVAGLINNDNLALVAVGVGLLGLVRWRERPNGWLLAAAFMLAGWTKLTALLMLVFGFAFVDVLSGRWRNWREHLPVILGATAGAIPSLVNLARYGAPVWRSPPPHAIPSGPNLDAALFLEGAAHRLAATWAAVEPSNPIAVLGLILILIVGAAACVKGWRRWPVAVGVMLALVPALALQLWFLWDTASHEGYLDQVNARYYYGVWPGFALGTALLWGLGRGPVRSVLTVVIGVCLLLSSALIDVPLLVARGGSLG
jgi:hypothetical protein